MAISGINMLSKTSQSQEKTDNRTVSLFPTVELKGSDQMLKAIATVQGPR